MEPSQKFNGTKASCQTENVLGKHAFNNCYCHANTDTRDCEETHGQLHGLKQSELSTPKLVKTNILLGPVVTVVNLVRANNRREALTMFNFNHVYLGLPFANFSVAFFQSFFGVIKTNHDIGLWSK